MVHDRKTESSDMQDLVQMMTQTLRMGLKDGGHEVDKGAFDSTTLPEFKLNRKYRDTLVLHGKARGEAEDLPLSKIPKGQSDMSSFSSHYYHHSGRVKFLVLNVFVSERFHIWSSQDKKSYRAAENRCGKRSGC